ncbi:hypothetical protein CAL7716_039120 [Calothrix sp. PCC 7716]|nr:hypothetical protein CAL7716_039120 [Calothrix sp. PCC 7716]
MIGLLANLFLTIWLESLASSIKMSIGVLWLLATFSLTVSSSSFASIFKTSIGAFLFFSLKWMEARVILTFTLGSFVNSI